MNRIYNIICTLLLLASYMLGSQAKADISTFNDAVKSAGTQEMLAQRMLKNYALTAMNDDENKYFLALKKDQKEFDKTLFKLSTFAHDDVISKAITEVNNLWRPIKKVLTLSPQKSNAAKLAHDIDKLVFSSNKVTHLLVNASNSNKAEIIQVSTRQGMLSERLSALYMMQVWGVDNPSFTTDLDITMTEFSLGQESLEKSALTSAEVNIRLKTVRKLFKWFEVIGKSGSGRFAPLIVDKFSDKIQHQMERVTLIYMKIPTESNRTI